MAPTSSSLQTLREEAAHCRACPLWKDATQTVFGEGPAHARAVLVGEQPGDKEDLAGKPFVGPAGLMLDRALEEAGIDRGKVYVTNAVKHFKFVRRGKIRLHQKPTTPEIKACRQWYERELAAIKPALVVAMGTTAAQSVFGKITPINENRGRLIQYAGTPVMESRSRGVLDTPLARGMTGLCTRCCSLLMNNRSLITRREDKARPLNSRKTVDSRAFSQIWLPGPVSCFRSSSLY